MAELEQLLSQKTLRLTELIGQLDAAEGEADQLRTEHQVPAALSLFLSTFSLHLVFQFVHLLMLLAVCREPWMHTRSA